MKFVLDYPQTSSFNSHTAAGGIRAKFAGDDRATGKNEIPFDADGKAIGYMRSFYVQEIKKYVTELGVIWVNGSDKLEYVHLEEIYVPFNQYKVVRRGELMGRAGGSGYVTGDHTHIGYIKDGVRKDPVPFLQSLYKQNLVLNIFTMSEAQEIINLLKTIAYPNAKFIYENKVIKPYKSGSLFVTYSTPVNMPIRNLQQGKCVMKDLNTVQIQSGDNIWTYDNLLTTACELGSSYKVGDVIGTCKSETIIALDQKTGRVDPKPSIDLIQSQNSK